MTHSSDIAQPSARSVSWLPVHRFITPLLDAVKEWPMVGTPAWCTLAHNDPRKWAALVDGGQHHALRVELAQEARAEASKAISSAADWPAIAREITQLRAFRSAHPWSVRDAS